MMTGMNGKVFRKAVTVMGLLAVIAGLFGCNKAHGLRAVYRL